MNIVTGNNGRGITYFKNIDRDCYLTVSYKYNSECHNVPSKVSLTITSYKSYLLNDTVMVNPYN